MDRRRFLQALGAAPATVVAGTTQTDIVEQGLVRISATGGEVIVDLKMNELIVNGQPDLREFYQEYKQARREVEEMRKYEKCIEAIHQELFEINCNMTLDSAMRFTGAALQQKDFITLRAAMRDPEERLYFINGRRLHLDRNGMARLFRTTMTPQNVCLSVDEFHCNTWEIELLPQVAYYIMPI